MFGCFRKGEANDPETYVAAITSTLARYPENIIVAVTHPSSGLPVQSDFLPSVKEVFEACEARMLPQREAEARRKRVALQLAERDRADAKDEKVAKGLADLAEHLKRGFSPSTQ